MTETTKPKDALPILTGAGHLVIATRFGDGMIEWIDAETGTKGSFPDSLKLFADFLAHVRASDAASFDSTSLRGT